MSVKRILKQYMKDHGLTQKKFAEKMGVTQAMVSQWMTGKRPIGPDRAIKMEKRSGGELVKEELNGLLGKLARKVSEQPPVQ